MALIPNGSKNAARDVGSGILLTREDLANTCLTVAGINLFHITGGNIIVTLLQLEVGTAALGAEAIVPVWSITTAAPYPVATTALCIAPVVTLTGAAIGTTTTLVGTTLGTACLTQTTIGPDLIGVAARLILKPGIISVASAVAATLTPTTTIFHRLLYYPLDNGASVHVV